MASGENRVAAAEPAERWFSKRRSGLLVLLSYGVAAVIGIWLAQAIDHRSFFELAASKGDNSAYIDIARAVLRRHLDDPAIVEHKRLNLGLPLAAALVSTVTRLDPFYTLPVTCWLAAALAWYFGYGLYG